MHVGKGAGVDKDVPCLVHQDKVCSGRGGGGQVSWPLAATTLTPACLLRPWFHTVWRTCWLRTAHLMSR